MNIGDRVKNGQNLGTIVDLDPEFSKSKSLRRYAKEACIHYIRVLWDTGQAYWEREDLLTVYCSSET